MPNYTKRFVCLANSRKFSGRCVAGKEISAEGVGGWIRPISSRPGAELTEEERRFENGQYPKLLDVVDVCMLRHEPHEFQTENHVINDQYYWRLVRAATDAEVQAALDADEHLWGQDSSYNGINDRVHATAYATIIDSLRLIEVEDLSVSVVVEGGGQYPTKRKVRGHFGYNGRNYSLVVTDPVVEREYFPKQNGTYDVGSAILCISLGEPVGGYAYKLIAGVILGSGS